MRTVAGTIAGVGMGAAVNAQHSEYPLGAEWDFSDLAQQECCGAVAAFNSQWLLAATVASASKNTTSRGKGCAAPRLRHAGGFPTGFFTCWNLTSDSARRNASCERLLHGGNQARIRFRGTVAEMI